MVDCGELLKQWFGGGRFNGGVVLMDGAKLLSNFSFIVGELGGELGKEGRFGGRRFQSLLQSEALLFESGEVGSESGEVGFVFLERRLHWVVTIVVCAGS